MIMLAAVMPLAPLAAALLGFLLRSRRAAAALAITATSAALLAAVIVALRFDQPLSDAYRAADFVEVAESFAMEYDLWDARASGRAAQSTQRVAQPLDGGVQRLSPGGLHRQAFPGFRDYAINWID